MANKPFHVLFTFDMPTPGAMIIVGETKEEAVTHFNENMKKFSNVSITQVSELDAEDVEESFNNTESFKKPN